jgi:hypothetical protein
VAVFPVAFLQAVQAAVAAQFTVQAPDVLYRSGYDCGLASMVELNRHLRERFGAGTFDLWQMEARFILDSWWASLAELGWGGCTFASPANSRGVFLATLKEHVLAPRPAGDRRPGCHLCAGLLAGGVSFLERTERHAVELECRLLGAPACQFLIGNGTEVDEAETFRQKGATAAEIVERVCALA